MNNRGADPYNASAYKTGTASTRLANALNRSRERAAARERNYLNKLRGLQVIQNEASYPGELNVSSPNNNRGSLSIKTPPSNTKKTWTVTTPSGYGYGRTSPTYRPKTRRNRRNRRATRRNRRN